MAVNMTQRAVRTIRLSDEQVARLLDHLDEQTAQRSPKAEHRGGQRYGYRVPMCTVRLLQPGSGSALRYVVPTRNISTNGFSFLHGGYVHVGTECEAQLINNHGGWQNVSGKVAHCRLVEGYIHEVGVQFAFTIDPGDFAARARTCRVLLVDDDELSARLAAHHLAQLGADTVRAVDGEEAVRMAAEAEFDLVLMDIEMPKMNGLDASRALRDNCYSGMIVAASVRSEDSDREASLEAGCDRHLAKPLQPKELAEVINSIRREPLTSTLRDDPEMAPLIGQFLEDIPKQIERILAALAADDRDGLIAIARHLRATAGGYGYGVITDAARDVETALQAKAPRSEVRTKVRELLDWCRLAR